MNSRLIGKMYHTVDMHKTLQSFIHVNAVDLCIEEFKKHGIQSNVSLIIFSAEAKKYEDINKVASPCNF